MKSCIPEACAIRRPTPPNLLHTARVRSPIFYRPHATARTPMPKLFTRACAWTWQAPKSEPGRPGYIFPATSGFLTVAAQATGWEKPDSQPNRAMTIRGTYPVPCWTRRQLGQHRSATQNPPALDRGRPNKSGRCEACGKAAGPRHRASRRYGLWQRWNLP